MITNSYPLQQLSLPQHEFREDIEILLSLLFIKNSDKIIKISAEIEKQREAGKKLTPSRSSVFFKTRFFDMRKTLNLLESRRKFLSSQDRERVNGTYAS